MKAQRGYTLIEVVVAFALLAAGIGLLLGVLSRSVDQVRWSARVGEAVAHADTLMDSIGVGAPVMPGTYEGSSEDGRYQWRVVVDEYSPEEDTRLRPGAFGTASPLVSIDESLRLYRVDLELSWGEGARESLAISSLRLQRVPLDGGPAL